MRGARTLFTDVFTPAEPQPEKVRRGRSAEFVARRNECLVDRYYFVGKEKGLSYDLLLKEISETFFISKITAVEIVQERLAQLHQLREQAPNRAYFIRRWPSLSWG